MYTIFSNIKKNCGWGISLSHFHNGKVAQPTRMLAWINGRIICAPTPPLTLALDQVTFVELRKG